MAVGKPTTLKDALRRWEEENEQEAANATEINLSFQWPPMDKMDNSLAPLVQCEKLSLSMNMIEKITGLNTLKNLRILSLSRNLIKSFAGLEPLGETLVELWISYNFIEKMKGINAMKNLRVLYMSNNLVKEWAELSRLQEMSELHELLFVGNPLCEGVEQTEPWRQEVARRLPNIDKLDGEQLIRNEDGTLAPKTDGSIQSGRPTEE